MRALTGKVREELPEITESDVDRALNSLLGFVNEKPLLTYKTSNQVAENSHVRTAFSSKLVHEFMMGISIKPAANMALSKLIVMPDIKLKIETLKHFSYLSVIMSSELKIGEYRGGDIVKALFKAFTSDNGDRLLPKDVRFMVSALNDESDKKRVICDFVAGMTDRYAVDFYNRLHGNAASLFKPI
jgi:dGTPase